MNYFDTKNVGDLGKLIVANSFKKLPKCKKSPTLVTLLVTYLHTYLDLDTEGPKLRTGFVIFHDSVLANPILSFKVD